MAGRPSIVLIGASSPARDELRDHFERRAYDVKIAEEEWAAEPALAHPGLDVAIVDLASTAPWGFELLRRREGGGKGPDFILVGSGAGAVDRVLALEMGAADFVDAPYVVRELAARVTRLLVRRGRRVEDIVVLERSTVDLKAALVMHNSGEEEQLSPGQIALFRLFVSSPYKVLNRDDIIADAPAEDSDAYDRSIDSRIVRLRRKLDTECIVTVRGAGYRYDPPRSSG